MNTRHKTSKIAIVLLVTALVVSKGLLKSQEQSPNQTRKPILILDERTRMGKVKNSVWQLNSLNPEFVLYDDGLVLFKKDNTDPDYFSVKLKPQEIKTLLENFKIDEFLKLKKSHSTNNKFHQPINVIKYWQGGKTKTVQIIGSIRDDEKDRNNSPSNFLRIFDQMISFQHPNSQVWVPYKLKIHLYSQTSPKGEPVSWPSGWPDLNHNTTKKRADADLSHAFEIHLDGTHKDEFELMLSKIDKYQPVMINDKPWYLAPQRYILPHEKMWQSEN